LIARFHLDEFVNLPIESLSHGTRQRVAIVSALLHDPEVFVIDEPMVGLDPQHARVVKDVLKERSRKGMTVLVSTHQLSVAEEMADRIGIIHNGRLCQIATLKFIDFTQWQRPNPVFSTKCLAASGGWTRKACKRSSSGSRASAAFSKRCSTRLKTACWWWMSRAASFISTRP
jgi:ABC-type multidrug transport system ATPase subunit